MSVKFGNHIPYLKSNLVIEINSFEDLLSCISSYNPSVSRVRGISLTLSLLETINKKIILDSNINYFQIIFDKTIIKPLVLSKLKGRNLFTEAVIPYCNYSSELVSSFSNVSRIIVEFDSKSDLSSLSSISADLISNRFFPFTRGIPFCLGKIDQMSEIFSKMEGNNLTDCNGCCYQKFCNGSNGFNVKPILVGDYDLLRFLEENEGSINRL